MFVPCLKYKYTVISCCDFEYFSNDTNFKTFIPIISQFKSLYDYISMSFVRFEIFFINMLKLKSETKNQDSLTAIFDSDSTTNNALGKFQ